MELLLEAVQLGPHRLGRHRIEPAGQQRALVAIEHRDVPLRDDRLGPVLIGHLGPRSHEVGEVEPLVVGRELDDLLLAVAQCGARALVVETHDAADMVGRDRSGSQCGRRRRQGRQVPSCADRP